MMIEMKKNPAAGGKLPLGLYLHIPFCRQKCLYCDFLSAPATQEVMEQYVLALCNQIAEEAPDYKGYEVQTVFFGGGTPSLLSALQLQRLMAQIRDSFLLAADIEITMESNPGTLDADRLAGYRAAGVNRLSIGLQSADDAQLRALGRIHDFASFTENYYAARRAGFSNINVDLMSALPGQSVESWMDTLKKITELSPAPEHISAYSLMIEEGTPFYERYGEEEGETVSRGAALSASGYLPLPSEEEERRMYELTECFLRQQGYHRYEISNYAKQGRECRHNVGYWKRTAYLGLGLGASSLVGNGRWKNTDDLGTYLGLYGMPGDFLNSGMVKERALSGEQAAQKAGKEEVHVLSEAEEMEEFMFLGLRLTAGVETAAFREAFGVGIREIYGPVLDKLEEENLILCCDDGKRLHLTPRGVDVSNYVLAEFLIEEE